MENSERDERVAEPPKPTAGVPRDTPPPPRHQFDSQIAILEEIEAWLRQMILRDK